MPATKRAKPKTPTTITVQFRRVDPVKARRVQQLANVRTNPKTHKHFTTAAFIYDGLLPLYEAMLALAKSRGPATVDSDLVIDALDMLGLGPVDA